MLITSGYEFEGYDIVEYVGHESAQVVLGTGFLSTIGSSFADFLGTTSSTYENKLATAEQICKQKLISKAIKNGCNAIVGIDVDFTTFTNDVMGVVVGGTFVKVMKKVPEKKTKFFTLKRYSLEHSVRCCNSILINMLKENKIYLGVTGKFYGTVPVEAMGVKVEYTTLFGDKNVVNNIMFADIEVSNGSEFSTEYVEIGINSSTFKLIKHIDVIIEKYVVGGVVEEVDSQHDMFSDATESALNVLRKNNGCDTVIMAHKGIDSWKCYCGQTNSLETKVCSLCQREVAIKNLRLVLEEGENSYSEFEYTEHSACLMNCMNAKEIYDYFKQINIDDPIIDNVVIPKLEDLKEVERFYGNKKESALKLLDSIYGNS